MVISFFSSCAQRPATTDGHGFCRGWTMLLLLAAGLIFAFCINFFRRYYCCTDKIKRFLKFSNLDISFLLETFTFASLNAQFLKLSHLPFLLETLRFTLLNARFMKLSHLPFLLEAFTFASLNARFMKLSHLPFYL
jgi:hypothetical protein